jgi:hypothetical protein
MDGDVLPVQPERYPGIRLSMQARGRMLLTEAKCPIAIGWELQPAELRAA